MIDDYLCYKQLQESLTSVECLIRINQAKDAIKTRIDTIEDLRKQLQAIKKAYQELTNLKAGAELTEKEVIVAGFEFREPLIVKLVEVAQRVQDPKKPKPDAKVVRELSEMIEESLPLVQQEIGQVIYS